MEKIIIGQEKINQLIKSGANRPALQAALEGASREYLIDGMWTDAKPTSRPKDARIVFPSIEFFRGSRDTYFVWEEITKIQEQNPVYPEVLRQRLLNARRTDELVKLFVPWGIRPQGTFGKNEDVVLNKLKTLEDVLKNRKFNVQTLIMPADLYATEVNKQIAQEQCVTYFNTVTKEATGRGFIVKPWSQIRIENSDQYQRRATQLTEDELGKLLTAHKIREAIAAAGRRSGYDREEDIIAAAMAYLRERICEAEIINTEGMIKVSVVPKNKDNEVDRELPRLYIVPQELQLPWLK